jgi:hypothetical protein
MSHITECPKISWQPPLFPRHEMPQQRNALPSHQEGRILLALQAYRSGQFKNLRRAADAYDVPVRKLRRRDAGMPLRRDIQPNSQKLTLTKESTIV